MEDAIGDISEKAHIIVLGFEDGLSVSPENLVSSVVTVRGNGTFQVRDE